MTPNELIGKILYLVSARSAELLILEKRTKPVDLWAHKKVLSSGINSNEFSHKKKVLGIATDQLF